MTKSGNVFKIVHMKKYVVLSIMAASFSIMSCDPIEDREDLGGGITADQLTISATPVVKDGVNSNYIVLESDGNSTLSSWDFGFGTYVGTHDTVKVMMSGDNTIVYSGLNPNGEIITKTIIVKVDKLYDVEPEWATFCGPTGLKTWVWDETLPACFGNGGYKGNSAPGWWALKIGEIDGQKAGEGEGASMVFSIKGASITKNLTDGTTKKGTFSFDMSKQTALDDGTVWAKGVMTTKSVTVLAGISINENKIDVNKYDILTLDDNKLALSYHKDGTGAWGEAWFWMFRAE